MKEQFQQRLRRLRTEKRLSQAELAVKLGVNRNSIVNWETGKCRPDASRIKQISRCFNVSAAYLCCQTDAMYHIMPTPVADIDMSKLSTRGMEKMKDYYELLLKDEQCRADG